MSLVNNGSSMVPQRLSQTTNGNHILLILEAMEDQVILDVQPQTQDGGNSSDTETAWLSMKKEKSYKHIIPRQKKLQDTSVVVID